MASRRTRRTVAGALLLVVLATMSTTATAEAKTPGHRQARYCKRVDAYRIKTCAKAILSPPRWAGSSNGCWPSSPARPPP